MTSVTSEVVAEMVEKMRVREEDDDRTVLSKKLSYVLRHGAKQLELAITDGGFVSVAELLAVEPLFGGVPAEALLDVVRQSNSEKQRYELIRDGDSWLIRATTKHTIQGVSAPPAARPKKSPKKSSKGSGPKVPSPADEEKFCNTWKLDRLARQRLGELPPASRHLAMQRFGPGPEVPPSDYSKVLVAFCKRFKGQEDKDDKDERYIDQQEDERSGTASQQLLRSFERQAPGESHFDEQVTASGSVGAWAASARSSGDLGQLYPRYPSPGSSQRSFDGSPRGQVSPSSPGFHQGNQREELHLHGMPHQQPQMTATQLILASQHPQPHQQHQFQQQQHEQGLHTMQQQMPVVSKQKDLQHQLTQLQLQLQQLQTPHAQQCGSQPQHPPPQHPPQQQQQQPIGGQNGQHNQQQQPQMHQQHPRSQSFSSGAPPSPVLPPPPTLPAPQVFSENNPTGGYCPPHSFPSSGGQSRSPSSLMGRPPPGTFTANARGSQQDASPASSSQWEDEDRHPEGRCGNSGHHHLP
ncbi:unnamed protein product, partial [Polarella glacialis]